VAAAVTVGLLITTSAGAVALRREPAAKDTAAATAPAPSPSAPELTAGERSARDSAVKAVLDRRARALLDRNRDAFLADVDRRRPAFVSEQERLFDNLRRLRLRSWRYSVVGEYGRDLSAVHGGPTWIPATLLRYQLAGYDARPVAEPLAPTFVLRGGRWLLAGDGDVDEDLPTGGHAEPWDVGPIAVAQGNRSLVIGSATDQRDLTRLARSVDDAVRSVRAVFRTGGRAGSW
jgi:hypothetical protein